MDIVFLLEKYHPKNLPDLTSHDFENLELEDYMHLAKEYPYMLGDLFIQKSDGSGIKSPATYRSLYSLLKSGHKFKIVGTKYPVKVKHADLTNDIEQISKMEYIKPEMTLIEKKRGRPFKTIKP